MLNKALKFIHTLEDSALIALVFLLLGLSLLQIIMRNLGVAGFIWAETATRVMVLWLAIFGALRASRDNSHIAIDIINVYTKGIPKRIIYILNNLGSAVVCASAAYYSYLFVEIEREDPVMSFLNVPTWICEAIIPFGLGIIAIRFVLSSFKEPPSSASTT